MNTQMIAASVTMGQLQKKMDTLSNNMANVNTIGYKRREASFNDLLFQQVNNQRYPQNEIGRLTPNGIRVGSGAMLGQTAIRFEQGSLQVTDRLLDVAITEKNQFFQVLADVNGEQQVRYTRDGAFYFSPNPANPNVLNLVTANGHLVLGEGGPIQIPANYRDLQINQHGSISITLQDGTEQTVDNFQMVRVERPQMLEQMGENLFGLPNNLAELGYAAGDILAVIAPGLISVQQGAVEMSNVDLSKEMTELMLAQRSYQFNSRSISMADQMMGLVNSIR